MKTALKIFACFTNKLHYKHSQLGSQITEPISAWKVYFRSPIGEVKFTSAIFNQPSVSYCALSGGNFLCCSFFFLKLLEQIGEGMQGSHRLESKLKRLGAKNNLLKGNAAASNQIKSNPLFEHVTIRSTECSLKRAHVYALLLINILIINKYKKMNR